METIENRNRFSVEESLLLADQMTELASDGLSLTIGPDDMERCARAIYQTVLMSEDWRSLARPFSREQD